MSARRKLDALCIAVALALACTPLQSGAVPARPSRKQNVPAVFSPTCTGGPDLRGKLTAFADLPVDILPVAPKLADIQRALLADSERWLLFLFSGHGALGANSRSAICLGSEQQEVDALLRTMTRAKLSKTQGAVLVLNACESASVDPRAAEIPVSIISASPFKVRTDSLFGESLGHALALAAEDWNCDGMITDQELFDALLAVLRRSGSQSQRPALPKLRRQAPSHIPLPIPVRERPECGARRSAIRALSAQYRDEWGPLGLALERQLALVDRPDAGPLPSAQDYYFVDGPDAGSAERQQIDRLAEAAELVRLPDSALGHAEALAAFATFAEFYRLDFACGYVRVHRLRDHLNVGSVPLDSLDRALPRRQGWSVPGRLFGGALIHRRVQGVASNEGRAVTCYEQTGQCFEPEREDKNP